MPLYTIETPSGRRLKIEANDEQTAMAGAQQWHDDTDAVVRTVWGEARNDPDSQAGVASVILNRSKITGQSPRDVVLAQGQFEPWGNPQTRQQLEGLDPRSPQYQDILNRVMPVLGGEDVTGGATHFYAPKAQAALGRPAPRWDNGAGRDMGQHRFFALPDQLGKKPAVEIGEAEMTSAPTPGQPQSGNDKTGVVYQDSRRSLPDAQHQWVRGAMGRNEFDRSARPGTRLLPYFQERPDEQAPDAAYWVDLDGKLHEPVAARRPEMDDPTYAAEAARLAEDRARTQQGKNRFGGPLGTVMNAGDAFIEQALGSVGAFDEVAGGIGYARQGLANIARKATGQPIITPAATAAKVAMHADRDRQKVFAAKHPWANAGATALGVAVSGRPVGGGAIIAQRPLATGAQTAAVQAPFALARQEGTLPERLPGAAKETAMAFGLASTGTAAARELQRAAGRVANRPVSDARTLSRAGIRLTPGQMAGGVIKRTEDLLTSAPLTGMGINAARTRGIEDFNRVAINRALGEINQALPGNVAVGRPAIQAADQAVSQAYDDALRGVQVAPDAQLQADINAVLATPNLPTQAAENLQAVLGEYQTRFAGPITGQVWKEIDSTLATAYRAADTASANDVGARYLRDAIGRIRDAHKASLGRVNPGALEAVEQADQATATLVRARDASTATGAKQGVFTPAQLNLSVKRADATGGKRAYRHGEARLQDLTDAGVEVMPNAVPDSGTALRLGALTAAGGASTAAGISPVFAKLLLADAIGAGIYSGPVQAALNAAYRATDPVAARAAAAQLAILASRDPALVPLHEAAVVRAASLPARTGRPPNVQARPQVPTIPQAPTRSNQRVR